LKGLLDGSSTRGVNYMTDWFLFDRFNGMETFNGVLPYIKNWELCTRCKRIFL